MRRILLTLLLGILLFPTPAYSQVTKVRGSQEFCLVAGNIAECKFDTAKGCEFQRNPEAEEVCTERIKLNQWPAGRYAR